MLGEVLDGQKFGDPVANPFGFVVTVWFRNTFIAEVGDGAMKQRQKPFALGRQSCWPTFGEYFDSAAQKVVGADFAVDDAESFAA